MRLIQSSSGASQRAWRIRPDVTPPPAVCSHLSLPVVHFIVSLLQDEPPGGFPVRGDPVSPAATDETLHDKHIVSLSSPPCHPVLPAVSFSSKPPLSGSRRQRGQVGVEFGVPSEADERTHTQHDHVHLERSTAVFADV